jgi:hypothetical protein
VTLCILERKKGKKQMESAQRNTMEERNEKENSTHMEQTLPHERFGKEQLRLSLRPTLGRRQRLKKHDDALKTTVIKKGESEICSNECEILRFLSK